MRSPKIVLCLLSILGVGVLTRRSPAQEPVPNNRIVIAASRVLDGKGGVLPMNHELIKRAVKIPGLKIVFGTDAVAGAHGRNSEELIDRVRDCGVDPMAALVSANSLNAEALGMADQIGSIAPGLQAEIIALDGDLLKDIGAVRHVVFVMKGGIVYKNVARTAIPAFAGVQP
jgi:adenine deaminase